MRINTEDTLAEALARVPAVAATATPADELSTITAGVTATVAYAVLEKFGAPDAEAAAIAERMIALTLAIVPDEVQDAIDLAIEEVGI